MKVGKHCDRFLISIINVPSNHSKSIFRDNQDRCSSHGSGSHFTLRFVNDTTKTHPMNNLDHNHEPQDYGCGLEPSYKNTKW